MVKEGSITVVNRTLWEAMPNVTYTTLSIGINAHGTYSYIGTFTAITDFIYTIEYIIITTSDSALIDYCNFNIFTNTSYDKLILGAEITPSSPQSIFKAPIPAILQDNRYKLLIQNKSSSIQNINVGIIIGSRRIN